MPSICRPNPIDFAAVALFSAAVGVRV